VVFALSGSLDNDSTSAASDTKPNVVSLIIGSCGGT
jgi:hypothetical protein